MESQAEPRKLVLVADDNRAVNDVIASVLTESGYMVVQAFDGIETVHLFETRPPDLTIIDYHMPNMDGIDVLKAIKKIDTNAFVIFMTGEGSEHVAVEAMKAGAHDYITKPLSFPDLIQLVDKLVQDHDYLLDNIRLKARGDAYKDHLVTLSETMGEALVTTDSIGRIQFMNYMARKQWGPEEQIKGRPLDELFESPEDEVFGKIKYNLAQGRNWFMDEFTFQRADGSAFVGVLTASALSSEIHAGGLVIVIRDMTEIDEMRRQVINAEKLASLGKVVEGVAHEIRNSLTSLGGFSRRLEKSRQLDERQKVYVDYIIEDVKRLEAMIQDIEEYVNYTKIHRPQFAATSIEDVIDESLIRAVGPGKFKGVAYEVNIPPETEPIMADSSYLVEAFWHLFVNACEAMDGQGKLEINVSRNPNYLVVDVIDTGKGIPGDELKDIFNPFYTSKVTGAGVGLSKVYMIVEEHGGFITVNSDVGKGTRMRVYLPHRRVPPPRPQNFQ